MPRPLSCLRQAGFALNPPLGVIELIRHTEYSATTHRLPGSNGRTPTTFRQEAQYELYKHCVVKTVRLVRPGEESSAALQHVSTSSRCHCAAARCSPDVTTPKQACCLRLKHRSMSLSCRPARRPVGAVESQLRWRAAPVVSTPRHRPAQQGSVSGPGNQAFRPRETPGDSCEENNRR